MSQEKEIQPTIISLKLPIYVFMEDEVRQIEDVNGKIPLPNHLALLVEAGKLSYTHAISCTLLSRELDMLVIFDSAMEALKQYDENQKPKSNLILPDKPGFIIPTQK